MCPKSSYHPKIILPKPPEDKSETVPLLTQNDQISGDHIKGVIILPQGTVGKLQQQHQMMEQLERDKDKDSVELEHLLLNNQEGEQHGDNFDADNEVGDKNYTKKDKDDFCRKNVDVIRNEYT
uniref:Apocytochrome f n=1 Tax=Zeugodacus cucurbitae TaxID=28588 RepID=A0A0A1X2G4_ZEUCU